MDWSVLAESAIALLTTGTALGLLGAYCYRRGEQAGAARALDELKEDAKRRSAARLARRAPSPDELLEEQKTSFYVPPSTPSTASAAEATQTHFEEAEEDEIAAEPTRPAVDQALLARCRNGLEEARTQRTPRVTRVQQKTQLGIGRQTSDFRHVAQTAQDDKAPTARATFSRPSLSPFAKRHGARR